MTERQNLGQRGEMLAKKYLQKNNYKIIATNYRIKRQEIDIIAKYKAKIIFVEVKTRVISVASQEENPLTARQTNNLKLAALSYCHENKISLETVQLDLIIILADTKKNLAELKHYRDIF
ncbi:YraN family protein [Candidatus Falkowbacteria bacterium]|uniref:Endonuclease n=1 Tax=Candidatus Falkowbacteria bacterium CG10_big_fil_rev_8_21_14_0_10_37_18 TaxID=1974562 RepID=A0A2H0V870_9BACT|nr:YraN family protein [Candidatus Falkowbacteria bacterium]NCQ13122.1 YraN family protein [Candidatus Falkowbacteria bacterium]OIO05841.1 MAG: hypothetical protein AUJ26_02115 [Candidatus Falkowbacteria bacterium CG1_02_37_21]PIR95261.1 MAG: endonuclease [Candidatus Falkowbacteria bacterium CG10_big_fil_rev_8_21_14_0_10_37_18]